jgi:hypothetical protein
MAVIHRHSMEFNAGSSWMVRNNCTVRRSCSRKVQVSVRRHPDLYFFLCLLAGLAAFLGAKLHVRTHPEILQAETGVPEEGQAARRAPA